MDAIEGRDFGLGENKKECQGFGELKVDWGWLGHVIKVSVRNFMNFECHC